MNITPLSPGMNVLPRNAVPVKMLPSDDLRFAAGPSSPNAPKGKKESWLGWGKTGMLIAGILTLWKAPQMVDFNKAGELSVPFNKNRGGYQQHVYEPGLVILGPEAMLGMARNDKINGSSMSVIDVYKTAKSSEGKVIPLLKVQVDFEVDSKNLYELYKDKLGGETSFPQFDQDHTIFVKTDDPRLQRIYLQHIGAKLDGQIALLAPTYRAEEFHTITHFLDKALNEGLKDVLIKEDDGREFRRDVKPLKELIPPFIKVNGIRITDIDLPAELEETLNARAEKPLDLEIADLKKDLAMTLVTRNEAEASVAQAKTEENATQDALKKTLAATGTIKVKELEAEANNIDATALQNANRINAEADKTAAVTLAEATVKAEQIRSEAKAKAAQIKADADASVIQAEGDAKAQAAKLVGQPVQKHPSLIALQRITGSQEALMAVAENPNAFFDFIDPELKLGLQLFNVNNGQNSNNGIIDTIIGQRAAQQQPKKADAKPATPPAAPAPQPKQ